MINGNQQLDAIEYAPAFAFATEHNLRAGYEQKAFNEDYCVVLSRPHPDMDQYHLAVYGLDAERNVVDLESILTSSLDDARKEFVALARGLKLTRICNAARAS